MQCYRRSVQKASEAVRKIRNVTRFLLGNLDDFDPDVHALPFEELRPLEQYMLHKLVRNCQDAHVSIFARGKTCRKSLMFGADLLQGGLRS